MQLDPNVTARGLVKLWNYFSHHIIASPGMAHPMQACFEESYVVIGAARTMDLMGDARMTAICRRFNKRMMQYQGVHYPDMYDMGYGYNLDAKGMVNCSCVADNSSTANGMLATLNNMHKGTGMSMPWILLVDTLAGSMIFLSISGELLWIQFNRRRAIGVAIFSVSATLALGLTLSRL